MSSIKEILTFHILKVVNVGFDCLKHYKKKSSYFCASLPLLSLLPVASNFQSTKSSNLKILFFTLAL